MKLRKDESYMTMLANFKSVTITALLALSGVPVRAECNDPPSVVEFSAGFQQPIPPRIHSEFETSFIQHKWFVAALLSLLK